MTIFYNSQNRGYTIITCAVATVSNLLITLPRLATQARAWGTLT